MVRPRQLTVLCSHLMPPELMVGSAIKARAQQGEVQDSRAEKEEKYRVCTSVRIFCLVLQIFLILWERFSKG